MHKIFMVAILAVLTLTGCETQSGGPGEPVAGDNRPSATDGAAAPTEAPEEEPEASGPLKFGQTFTWDNNVSVTIGAPEPYTPTETACCPEPGQAAVLIPVTLVNKGAENYDPSLFSVTLQSGNVEADAIFDSGAGIDGAGSTPILPGRETAFKVAFAVTNPADLVLQVSPGFEYDPAIFTS